MDDYQQHAERRGAERGRLDPAPSTSSSPRFPGALRVLEGWTSPAALRASGCLPGPLFADLFGHRDDDRQVHPERFGEREKVVVCRVVLPSLKRLDLLDGDARRARERTTAHATPLPDQLDRPAEGEQLRIRAHDLRPGAARVRRRARRQAQATPAGRSP
jgi:hypothetical protein